MRTHTNYADRNIGMGLVEVIIYIAIIVLIFAVIVNLLISFSSATSKIKNIRAVSISVQTFVDRFFKETRSAQRIIFADSVFNANPGVLKIEGIGGSPTTTFSIVDNRIQMIQSGPAVFLTDDRVKVNSLIFRSATTSISESVKIELQLETGYKGARVTKNFYTYSVLRGSY